MTDYVTVEKNYTEPGEITVDTDIDDGAFVVAEFDRDLIGDDGCVLLSPDEAEAFANALHNAARQARVQNGDVE